MASALNTDQAVRSRYSDAAEKREEALCCPVDYDARYLEVIPAEVIERDYGCGDPSKYVHQGETVLDLGSGGGKICFIASQVVGPRGHVIGVDMNDTMLELARRSQPTVARRVGYDNVRFLKGKIQDLAIDRDVLDRHLRENPVVDEASLQAFEVFETQLRRESPMVADESVDVVVSNCVLNLVDSADKAQLFREIHRVLKPGGRAVISDIVSDKRVPQHLQQDADLWSGCISGAFEQREFLRAFETAGFHGLEIPVLQTDPWQRVEGIEFRSATVIAYKGESGPPSNPSEAIIYRGPFARVMDDEGQVYERGERTAVCCETLEMLTRQPYATHFIPAKRRSSGSQALPLADSPAATISTEGDCCGDSSCC